MTLRGAFQVDVWLVFSDFGFGPEQEQAPAAAFTTSRAAEACAAERRARGEDAQCHYKPYTLQSSWGASDLVDGFVRVVTGTDNERRCHLAWVPDAGPEAYGEGETRQEAVARALGRASRLWLADGGGVVGGRTLQ